MGLLIVRGEVRWYRFAPPDKKRPVVVLTRNSILEYLNEVTIAPITTTIRGIPSEVVLSEIDGLRHECAINLDHLQTIPKAKIGALIGSLSSAKMHEVQNALLFALGFDAFLY